PGIVQLTLLGVVMLVAAIFMMRPSPGQSPSPGPKTTAGSPIPRPLILGIVGLAVGALTGLIGIGGGFLFVPALVLLAGIPMKRAVGTSLLVIAMNTGAALVGYQGQATIDWPLVAAFTACAVVGSLVGARLAG